jgi:uncharacterized alkaline shock family protein YloU
MDKGFYENQMGHVEISSEVIADYAGGEAIECFGIVGMAAQSMADGLVRILKKESLRKGVDVTINDNKITIDFHVIVAYGVSIMAVCENLCENVKYKVETFTGMDVDKINVFVDGVRVVD